ncbi:MAG TPA: general stress protein CsbD [Flavobacteriales bacterium]|nr:general stress protein CsbD [Flavobacteriales bacterium]HMR27427.1 general stress protein CsbD [Flavobacteriales bacterium]
MEHVKTNTPTAPFKIAVNTWGDKKTKLKNKFSQLSDSDLQFVEGKESELTARLQTKLNKSEADVQKLITEL